jgi:hypothetical protein
MFACQPGGQPGRDSTAVAIQGEKFLLNGRPTYEGRSWNGYDVEGLLLNARLVQGIFDDLNDQTRDLWKYPDTGKWDPGRNANEFVAAMPSWRNHGMLAFTLNIQGGSPVGYGNQDWLNPGYQTDGSLREDYMSRLGSILDRANELEMVVILGLFYFGQDHHLEDEDAVVSAVRNVIDWLHEREYRHVLIEINNECNVRYDHEILKPPRVHELIEMVKSLQRDGFRYLVSTSFGGGSIPTDNVVASADFVLLHGNGVDEPVRIRNMVEQVRGLPSYTPKPILFNEDDHYDFDLPDNNLVAAVQSYASWGFFDFRRDGESFEHGYQSVPVDWSISSPRKKAFFEKIGVITGYH